MIFLSRTQLNLVFIFCLLITAQFRLYSCDSALSVSDNDPNIGKDLDKNITPKKCFVLLASCVPRIIKTECWRDIFMVTLDSALSRLI